MPTQIKIEFQCKCYYSINIMPESGFQIGFHNARQNMKLIEQDIQYLINCWKDSPHQVLHKIEVIKKINIVSSATTRIVEVQNDK